MEALIISLPILYCFFTGILIAWGMQVFACLYSIINTVTHYRKRARTLEVIQLSIVAIVTIVLFILLFYATSFAAFHMASIFFSEIWYAIFLFYVTSSSFEGEVNIREKFPSTHIISFHR